MKVINMVKAKMIVMVVLMVSVSSFGQYRDHTFNAPGNGCHFNYLVYAPNGNYTNLKRPFIYILSPFGTSIYKTYSSDSLKSLPLFHNYLFVYVPNLGDNLPSKVSCLDALVGLGTWSYECGRSNVFFYTYDRSFKAEDFERLGLLNTFHSCEIAPEPKNNNSNQTLNTLVTSFRENKSDYYKVQEDGELGTYYYVDDEDDITIAQITAPQKTYFGQPTAYNFNLSGTVRDKITGETLPYANIRIKGSSSGSSTNMDGYYTMSNIPNDTSVLIVSYVGYGETEIFLDPMISKKYFIIEIVPSSSTNLKEFTVFGSSEDVVLSQKDQIGLVKITPKQIEKLPNLGEKDIMRSFQLMPGVSASQESSSGLYVRGGTPDQNLILFDGFTVYHVDHLYGFFSAFNSNALKDVQLYKGGFESRFGGRLSSVTEITGKDGNQKKFNIGGDISLLSFNVYAEIPVGDKFTSIVAFRRSYKGPIYNKLFEKFNTSESEANAMQAGPGGRFGQNQATVKNYFYDLNGKFTYRPNNKDILSLSFFNGTDKLDNSNSFSAPSFGGTTGGFSQSSNDLTRYGNVGSSLRWSRKWTEKLYGNTILSYSNYYSTRDRSQTRTSSDSNGDESSFSNGIFENNDLIDVTIKSDYDWNIFKNLQIQTGLFATLYDIEYTYAQNDTTTVLDKNDNAILTGGYLQGKFKLFKDKLSISPGVRSSYFTVTNLLYHEPRIATAIAVTKKLTLKGSIGKYYQFANRVTREDILSGSKDFWLLSNNSSVPVSSSVQYNAGLSYETFDYLLSVEGYYKNVYDITEYSLRFNPSPSGVSYDENFFTGSGYARGLEFLVQKKSGKFNGWVSYTLGESLSQFDIYSDSYYYSNQDVSHEFKVVALYEYKRWDFSATFVFATGRPYTAPSGAYFVSLLDGTTQDFFTVTTKNGLRLPDYHRADVSAKYKLLAGDKADKKRREIGYLSFSIFNLYNRTNVWYKTYSIEDGSVVETNVNYTGITPNLTLSLKMR